MPSLPADSLLPPAALQAGSRAWQGQEGQGESGRVPPRTPAATAPCRPDRVGGRALPGPARPRPKAGEAPAGECARGQTTPRISGRRAAVLGTMPTRHRPPRHPSAPAASPRTPPGPQGGLAAFLEDPLVASHVLDAVTHFGARRGALVITGSEPHLPDAPPSSMRTHTDAPRHSPAPPAHSS